MNLETPKFGKTSKAAKPTGNKHDKVHCRDGKSKNRKQTVLPMNLLPLACAWHKVGSPDIFVE